MKIRKKAARRANDGTAKKQIKQPECTLDSASTQVRRFVETIAEPDDILEVRILPEGSSEFHRAAELLKRVPMLLRKNRSRQNIYVGVNARKRTGGKKATDVKCARSIFADWDNASLADARQRWEQAGLPSPSLIVASGHGIHGYWLLDEPLSDLVEWTRLQKALAVAVGSDPMVCDPPRIMRLPGFLNMKKEPVPCAIV